MKTRILITVLTLLVFGITYVFAQDEDPTPLQERMGKPGMMGQSGMMGGPGFQMMERLKLTDEQKKEMEKSRFDMIKQAIDREAKVKTARVELAQLFRADNPDKGSIEKKINEISQLQAQGKLAHVNHWFAVNKMLTPEQQKIWKNMLGQAMMMKRMNNMRQGFQRPAIRGQMLERMMQEHDRMGR